MVDNKSLLKMTISPFLDFCALVCGPRGLLPGKPIMNGRVEPCRLGM